MTRDNGEMLNVQPATQKKIQFDVGTEKETFFEVKDALIKDNVKFPVYKIPLSFDSKNTPRSQRKVSTLKFFLEICLTLAKDHDALTEIEHFLYR